MGGVMSKISIAIGAFLMGVYCSALFPSQAGKSNSPVVNWPDFHTLRFHGGGTRAGGGINISHIGATPIFNSLDHMPVLEDFTFASVKQPLDGLNCTNCKFEDAALSYAGGVVNLRGSTFSGTTKLQLEGAAANTIALLEFLKAIPKGTLQYKLPINRPITKNFSSAPAPPTQRPPAQAAPVPQPKKMDFTAPYIGR